MTTAYDGATHDPTTYDSLAARRARPKIGDVATLAGVSKSAVSFVFNDRPGVGAETRIRILAAAEQLGWYPSAQARALSNKRASALGLVIQRPPELLNSDPFFTQFLAGVEIELSRRRYALVLQVVPSIEAERASYRALAIDGRVDGVFLTDVRTDDRRPELLRELQLPAIVIGPVDFPGHVKVTVDDAAGIRAAIEHLAALGHRRIAHVTGPAEYAHSALRRDAWRSTLDQLGLPAGPLVEGDFSGASGARATKELLDLAEPPTAIFYANDLMAIAGMQVASLRGLSVPRDLSVIGFDDVPMAEYCTPALTTVRQDVLRWGETAAKSLLRALDGLSTLTPPLPVPALVVRGSTAPPHASTTPSPPESSPLALSPLALSPLALSPTERATS